MRIARRWERPLGLLVPALGAGLGYAAWWLAFPALESALGRIPGRAGAAAVGLGTWLALAALIGLGYLGAKEILKRRVRRRPSAWIAAPGR